MSEEPTQKITQRWCNSCKKWVVPVGKRKINCPECNSFTSIEQKPISKKEEKEEVEEDFSKTVPTKLNLDVQNIISDMIKKGDAKNPAGAIEKALRQVSGGKTEGGLNMTDEILKEMEKIEDKDLQRRFLLVKLKERESKLEEGGNKNKEVVDNPRVSVDDTGITSMIDNIEKAKQKAYMSKIISGLYGFPIGEERKGDVKDKEVEALKQQLKELEGTIKKQDEERKRELERERMDKKFEALQKQMLEMSNKKDDGSTFEKLFMFDQKNRMEIDKIKESNESERKKIEAELQKERDERFRQEISRISDDFKREIGQRMTQDGFSEALKDKMQKQILEKVDVEKIITGKDKEGGSVAAEIFANTTRELAPALKSLAEGYAMKQQSRAMGGEPQMVDPNALTDSQISQFSPEDQARIRSMRGQGQPSGKY